MRALGMRQIAVALGEEHVLRDLAHADSAGDADLVSALLAFEPTIDVGRLVREAALPAGRVLRALTRLGAAGRVGFDAHAGSFFHQELPYAAGALEAMHPRLRDARELVASGAVRFSAGVGYVRSGETEYVVRPTGTGHRCSCPWYGKHQDDRGPCKHALAVELSVTG